MSDDLFKREIFNTIKNIAGEKEYIFNNSPDMSQYADQLKKIIEENSVFKIAKIDFEDRYTLHLILSLDPLK